MTIKITAHTRKMIEDSGYKANDFNNGLTRANYLHFMGSGMVDKHPLGSDAGRDALLGFRAYDMSGGNAAITEQDILLSKTNNQSYKM